MKNLHGRKISLPFGPVQKSSPEKASASPPSRHHYILLAISGKQGAQCLMVRLCLTPQDEEPCPNQREMPGNFEGKALCDDPAFNNNFAVTDTDLACSSPSSILNFVPCPSKIRKKSSFCFCLEAHQASTASIAWSTFG